MLAKVKKILIYSALTVVGVFILLLIIGLWANQSEGPALFYDSFLSKDLPLPKPVNVTFTDADGTTHKVPSYSGEIKLVVEEGATLDEVKALVEKHEGKIVGQIIEAGIYLVQVPAGKENDFIAAIVKEPKIIDAYPNFQFKQDNSVLIDGWKDSDLIKFTDLNGNVQYTTLPKEAGGVFGSTQDKNQAASHGELVEYFKQGKKPEAVNKNDCLKSQACIEKADSHGIIFGLLEALKTNREGNYITVNLSLSPGGEQADSIKSVTRKSLYNRYFTELLRLLKTPDRGATKMIVINSAGNQSLDLTSVFKDLASRQVSLDRLIIVGALDESGNIADYSNYSTNPKDIIYVPVVGKISGTSFAAPQITYLINKILDEYPELAKTPEKLKEILFHQSVATKEKEHYFIADPYSPETLKNALAAARDLLGLEKIKEEVKQKEKLPSPPPPAGGPLPPPEQTTYGPAGPTKVVLEVPANLPAAEVGKPYQYSFNNPTGGQPPYHFQVEGGFPPFGIILDLNGILSGTPTAEGRRTFSVCAVDLAGVQSCKQTILSVAIRAPVSNVTAPVQAIVGPTAPVVKLEELLEKYVGGEIATPTDFRIDSSSCKRISSSKFEISVAGFASGPNSSSLSMKVFKKDPQISGGYGPLLCPDWHNCRRSGFFDNPESTVWSYTESYDDLTSAFDTNGRPNIFQVDLLFNFSSGGKVNSKTANVGCQRETHEEALESLRDAAGLPTKPPAINFSVSERLPDAFVGKYYNYKFEASGGISPYSFQLKSDSGALPSGMLLSYDGVLLGKPNQKESKTFTVCARDKAFQEICRTTTLTVGDAPPSPPPPPPAPNCSDGKYNKCQCNDGKTFACTSSDYYVQCLSGGGAKCVTDKPPPPPTPACSSGKTLCQGKCWSCNPGYNNLYCPATGETGEPKCIPEPGSITGHWSGTYSTPCLSGNWNANVVDNNGTVSGNFSENKGFVIGPISGTYTSDNVANLRVSSGEYSISLNGTVIGNSFSGTLGSFCIRYVPNVGVQKYPVNGNFSGQKD